MKRSVFFFLSLLLFYIAGMYRYLALMVLAVGQILLLIVLTAQIYICGKHIQVGFRKRTAAATKKERFLCELSIENKGRFPVGGLRFGLSCGYGDRKKKEYLYGSGRDKTAVFEFCPPHCGISSVNLECFWVYDYLLLGAVKKKSTAQMQITIFPRDFVLDVRILEDGRQGSMQEKPLVLTMGGDDEIHQIREYREGEPLGTVHWKLSARKETLLVKEYEQQKEGETELFLDWDAFDFMQPEQRDAFYELLSALLLGILRKKTKINVLWQGDSSSCVDIGRMEIREAWQCRSLLAELYQRNSENRKKERTEGAVEAKWQKERGPYRLTLDGKLRLFQGKRLLQQFSRENLEEEILKEKIFIL